MWWRCCRTRWCWAPTATDRGGGGAEQPATTDPTTGARALPIYATTAYQFRDTQHAADLFALRELLAELDAPLVERVDVPDRALGEDAVLVERHQRAERRPVDDDLGVLLAHAIGRRSPLRSSGPC